LGHRVALYFLTKIGVPPFDFPCTSFRYFSGTFLSLSVSEFLFSLRHRPKHIFTLISIWSRLFFRVPHTVDSSSPVLFFVSKSRRVDSRLAPLKLSWMAIPPRTPPSAPNAFFILNSILSDSRHILVVVESPPLRCGLCNRAFLHVPLSFVLWW